MNSTPYSKTYVKNDTETIIHELEQEAYVSVLRAFRAQGDALTWEKEGLLTELRKELRLSNEEHRCLLSKVNSDETIKRIRDQRQSGGLLHHDMHDASQMVHDPVPSPSVSAASCKKKKITPTIPSQPFSGPSPLFRPQMMPSTNQRNSSSTKRGPVMGPKGKKQVQVASSAMKMQHSAAGRGQFSNRISQEGASLDSLIDRKLRTRWPDDNNFYEAVITDYKPDEGRHLLVYDKGTQSETWEWVNLSEISPDDIQWASEDPGVSRHEGYVGQGHVMNKPLVPGPGPGPGRGKGIAEDQSMKEFPPSENGSGKKGHDDIQLLHTNTLINEVEKVFSNNPNPVEIEKAKKVLKEHEQALMDAIARLNELSDGECDEGGRFLQRQAI